MTRRKRGRHRPSTGDLCERRTKITNEAPNSTVISTLVIPELSNLQNTKHIAGIIVELLRFPLARIYDHFTPVFRNGARFRRARLLGGGSGL